MAQTIIPVGNKLLLKKSKQKTKTASGFIIPEIAQKIDEVYEWLYENYSHKFRQRYGAHYKRKHFSFD